MGGTTISKKSGNPVTHDVKLTIDGKEIPVLDQRETKNFDVWEVKLTNPDGMATIYLKR